MLSATTPPLTMTDTEIRAIEPVLLAYARRAVGASAEAVDLVQETLLAAVSNQETFDQRSQLRTWLIGILSHKIADHFRKKKKAGLNLDAADPDDLLSPCPRPSPEGTASRRQMLVLLNRAIADLPELERLAVLMIDVEGVDRAEACNILAVQPTHLRVLLHRARHRLRKALEHVAM
jgi:RNA polymerase sigma factor (sigma-70 family)